jgi:ADP-ribose pyrophosphatase YjhB (NUDIX family)
MICSSGIACCRRETETGPLQILLVRRRTTYEFQEFVFGKYKLKCLPRIKYLISRMTAVEQNELLLKNFDSIWWLATLKTKESRLDMYNKKLYKFNAFLQLYNIVSIVSQSQSVLGLWEIPKGRANSSKESEINCAVREFYEETNIEKSMYKIIFSPVKYSFQDNNHVYKITYFPAWCKFMPHVGRIQPTKKDQVCEIVEIRWMDINMIKVVGNKRLETVVKKIFENVKNSD